MAPTDLGSSLLHWYYTVARDLPWRRTRDPYAIWISEIMLQQTRVETVVGYYLRFLERFPTVGALAAAPLEEVLALWSGLGYYGRARRLHLAAGEIVALGGELPRTSSGLRRLAGIGDYTAAAVASIAFNEVIPVLDGNVERVLCRVLAIGEDPKRREVRRRLLVAATSFLDSQRPGDSNQALMELGATVCSPRAPHCRLCPLAVACSASAKGNAEAFPVPRARKAECRIQRCLGVVEQASEWLLFRRPEEEKLLAGTWEFPWIEVNFGLEKGGHGTEQVAALFGERFGGNWRIDEDIGTVRTSITFRRIEYHVLRASIMGGDVVAEGREAGFFSAEALRNVPTSSQVMKVLRLLESRQRTLGF